MIPSPAAAEARVSNDTAYPVVTFDVGLAEELTGIDFDYQRFGDIASDAGLDTQQIQDLRIRYCTDETMRTITDKAGKPLSGDSVERMGLYHDGTCYIAIDRIKTNAILSGIELDDETFSQLLNDFTVHETAHYIEDVLSQRLEKLGRGIGSAVLSMAMGSRAKQRWLPHERFAYKFQDKHAGSEVLRASVADDSILE